MFDKHPSIPTCHFHHEGVSVGTDTHNGTPFAGKLGDPSDSSCARLEMTDIHEQVVILKHPDLAALPEQLEESGIVYEQHPNLPTLLASINHSQCVTIVCPLDDTTSLADMSLLAEFCRQFDLPVIALVEDWTSELDRLLPLANVTPLPHPWNTACIARIAKSKLQELRKRMRFERVSGGGSVKAEFLANISHELRTPLTAMLGYTEILKRLEEDETKLAHIRTISRNGQFLSKVIEDILSISKLDAGELEVEARPCSPRNILHDVTETLNHQAAVKGLRLDCVIEYDVPKMVVSDAHRLRQILTNLVGNAIKFTVMGDVIIQLDWVDDTLIFQVKDTGVGIEPSQVDHLFEPFVQADNSASRSQGGTGLGLAISRNLAQLLGGDVTLVESGVQGSVFACTVNAPAWNKATVGLVEEPATQLDLACKVLVVDDQRDVRYLARHVLENAGADVIDGVDGIECLELVEAQQDIDIVLLDMQMPRMDGYTAAKKLRESGFVKPILAVTTNVLPGDREKCLESGCTAFMGKPIDVDTLIGTVKELVARA